MVSIATLLLSLSSAVQSLAQLTAVFNTYKAACRRHGVPMYKPLSQSMEQNVQEKGGKIDKVCKSYCYTSWLQS